LTLGKHYKQHGILQEVFFNVPIRGCLAGELLQFLFVADNARKIKEMSHFNHLFEIIILFGKRYACSSILYFCIVIFIYRLCI